MFRHEAGDKGYEQIVGTTGMRGATRLKLSLHGSCVITPHAMKDSSAVICYLRMTPSFGRSPKQSSAHALSAIQLQQGGKGKAPANVLICFAHLGLPLSTACAMLIVNSPSSLTRLYSAALPTLTTRHNKYGQMMID